LAIFGTGRETQSLPNETFEKTPGNWIEQQSQEITTYELELKAVWHESTNALDIQDIRKFGKQITTEIISETPVPGEELQVNRLLASFDGSDFIYEGSIENTGLVDLEEVQVEMLSYSYANIDNATTQRAPMQLGPIAVGKTVEFQCIFTIEEKFRFYNIRFVLPSGQEIPHSVSWQGSAGRLLVHWLTAVHSGYRAFFDGSVENTGQKNAKRRSSRSLSLRR
jgi:hypothetical protein